MPGTLVTNRLKVKAEKAPVMVIGNVRAGLLLKHWKGAWAAMLREVEQMVAHGESWFDIVIERSLDDDSIFGNCLTQTLVEADWMLHASMMKEVPLGVNKEELYLVMPIPGGPLYRRIDFELKLFVRRNGEMIALCPILFGLGVQGSGLTYVHMKFSTVKPTPEELDSWAWIQREILDLTCYICAKPALHTCGGCSAVSYCSEACQSLHWKMTSGGHKGACAAAAARKKKAQGEGGGC